jgi:hypothetical protein
MKKLLAILALTFSTVVVNTTRAQDAQTLVPYFLSMIDGLGKLDNVMKDSEDQLKNINKALGAIRDANRYLEYSLAVRSTINNLVCIGEQVKEINFVFTGLGYNQSNLLSDFLECQYSIYYQTIEIEYNLIGEKVARAFDLKEQIDIKARLQLIDEVLTSLESIRYRTVQAQTGIVEILNRELELERDIEYYNLISRL